ncbi:hypothetical protein CI1B_46630 [Bradyrhizobium ivorense]|uniref:Uncharacterized protein n=1 Tax=Bradyrhizobium ivorense TaxID=2511166 RepID=A0A508TDD8_9BRAD|nr:hypothetical protein CI1B_46630 [Bradyrhizobium ivorense]
MKDVFCLAVLAAKVLCLMVFVTVVKPDGSIGAIRTSTETVHCRVERPGSRECNLKIFAAASQADARP